MPSSTSIQRSARGARTDGRRTTAVSGLAIASMPGESASPVSTTSGATTKSTSVYAAFCSGLYTPCGGGVFAQLEVVRLHRPQLRQIARRSTISRRLPLIALAISHASQQSAATQAKNRCQRRPLARS